MSSSATESVHRKSRTEKEHGQNTMSYQGDSSQSHTVTPHKPGKRVRGEQHRAGTNGKHDIGVEANKERIAQMTLALVNQARVIVEQQRELERLRAVEARVYPNRRRVKQI